MAKSGGNALQKGLYDALRLVEGLGAEIYDFVPQKATYPYVRIGLDTMTDFDTKNDTGRECDIMLHVWAKESGGRLVKQIIEKIYNALHRQEQNVTVDGFNLVQLVCGFTTIMVESSYEGGDRYQHGVMRFNALIEEV